MGRWMFRRRSADVGGRASVTVEPEVLVSAACVSDVGRSRGHNEDNFGEDAKLGLWVVADGMGGHEAGEVASDLAVSHIFRQVADGTSVAEAVSKAHDLIRRAPSQGIGAPGMGTTVVAAQMTGSRYRIYWVGDSRAYLQGSEGLRRLTADHSYVQRLLDQGVITAEQAKIHPERSVITQCLGVEGLPSVQVGETEGELYDGEVLLLCSDGLTEEVSEADIAAVLGEEAPIREKAQHLIDKANANGGSDNITVVLIPAPATAGRKPEPTATRKIPSIGVATAGRARKRRRVVGWAIAAVVILAISTAAWHLRGQVVARAKPIISDILKWVGPESDEEEAPPAESSPGGLQEQDKAKEGDSDGSEDGGPADDENVEEGVGAKKPAADAPKSPGRKPKLPSRPKEENGKQQVIDDPAVRSSVTGTISPEESELSAGASNGQERSP